MLSLYIHIPFCVGKCPYCGFYSTPYAYEKIDLYLEALAREAALCAGQFSGRAFDTLYVGGGTPTTLFPDQLGRLFRAVREHFSLAEDAEVTVEANPKTVTREKLELLLKEGANRLSIGVQSFSDAILQTLGRLHSARDAEATVASARKAGFRNIGTDLIYGIPGQTDAVWKESLDRAVDLGPEHVSAYCLSLDEGTHFTREAEAGRLRLPDDGAVSSRYELARSVLGRAGHRRYEISNFSRPGFECRHNLNYWKRGEYLGLGAGAWSFIAGRRTMNAADVDAYCEKVFSGARPVSFEELVGEEQAASEALMLGLRTAEGVDLRAFEREYGGSALMRIMRKVPPFERNGLVLLSSGLLRLTDRGVMMADSVTEGLF